VIKFHPADLMPFKKFVQSILNKLWNEDTVKIRGTFRNTKTGEIIDCDTFDAHLIGKGDLEETYKTYLAWFNHTRLEGESAREFVAVEKVEGDKT